MFTLQEQEIINQALLIIESKRLETESIGSTALAKKEAILHLGTKEREFFTVFFLNTQHQIIDREDLFLGTIDSAMIYPREIVKAALKLNAFALILAHNHPSGNLEPSCADRLITTKIVDALKLVNIQVLDHIIVGKGKAISFSEMGYM